MQSFNFCQIVPNTVCVVISYDIHDEKIIISMLKYFHITAAKLVIYSFSAALEPVGLLLATFLPTTPPYNFKLKCVKEYHCFVYSNNILAGFFDSSTFTLPASNYLGFVTSYVCSKKRLIIIKLLIFFF